MASSFLFHLMLSRNNPAEWIPGMVSIYLYYPLLDGKAICGFSKCWEESPVEHGWPLMHKLTLILINKECHCPYGVLFSFEKVNKQITLCTHPSYCVSLAELFLVPQTLGHLPDSCLCWHLFLTPAPMCSQVPAQMIAPLCWDPLLHILASPTWPVALAFSSNNNSVRKFGNIEKYKRGKIKWLIKLLSNFC